MAETAKKEEVQETEETRMNEEQAENLAREFERWDSKILKLQKSVAGDFWDLGEALSHIQNEELYKVLPDCTTFTQYLQIRELNQKKKASSWNCIRVFKRLSREKAIELGRTVSYAITSLTGNDFDEALKLISRKKFSTRKAKAIIAEKKNVKSGKKTKPEKTPALKTLTVINSRTNEVHTVVVPKGEVQAVTDDRKIEKIYAIKVGSEGLGRLKPVEDKKMKKDGYENGADVKIGSMHLHVFLNDKGQVKVVVE